ncbi:MAG: hypothetical protein J1E60_03245 [Christensenellaceae bacterium]|nr:hypothetical protein [Christensenellaceae bacterium]
MKKTSNSFTALKALIALMLLVMPIMTGCDKLTVDSGMVQPNASEMPQSGTQTPEEATMEPTENPTDEPTKVPVPDVVWDGSTADGFAGGKGTEDDPYFISNGAELAYLSKTVNEGTSYEGKYFKLTDDICLNDTTDWESWQDGSAPMNEWTAIGHTGYYADLEYAPFPFSGTFDGDNHSIMGIYIYRPEQGDANCYQGLFGYAENAVIQNVCVEQSYIHAFGNVGGIVGFINADTLNENSKLLGCRNEASVVGNNNVGGIVGLCALTDVENCSNLGSISGESTIGGIVGDNRGKITNCYNIGNISGDGTVGGIAGWNKDSYVTRCVNAGTISGNNNIGGVVGDNYHGIFSDSYNFGSVSGEKLVGGVAGQNCGSMTNCYNVGTVNGETLVGGIVGEHTYLEVKDMGYMTNCYCLDSCGASETIGVIEPEITYGKDSAETIENVIFLTNEQMKDAKSFVGFDFDKTWTMDGADYPYPTLIGISMD